MRIDDLPSILQHEALSAAHEAGHAVACEALGRPYIRVTLSDESGPSRVESSAPIAILPGDIESDVLCALAGPVAETMIFSRRDPAEAALGGLGDGFMVRKLLGAQARDEKLVARLIWQVMALVEANLIPIKRVAKALIANGGELSPAEVRRTYQGIALVVPRWID